MSARAKIFFPNLDGLRFFCFLTVFFYHSFATDYLEVKSSGLYYWIKLFLFQNGNLGVNFFFVLSGFLITYLLLVEKNRFQKINVRNFYIRRMLRIWPLFFFCVFFGFVIFPQIKFAFGQQPTESANPAYYLFFLNNIDFINKGLPDASVLAVLWSVAIEEQFYLVWPLLINFLSPRNIFMSFLLIVVGTFCFRYFNADNYLMLENHTFSCISDMAVGGFFAFAIIRFKKFQPILSRTPKWIWLILYNLVAAVFLFRTNIFHHSAISIALDRLVISILFGLVILEQNYAEHSLFKMSKFKTLSKLGTYTYGLYCLHMIGILIVAKFLSFLGWNKNVYQVIFLEGGLSLAITIGLALISYNLFEKRFLALKDNFAMVKTKTTGQTDMVPENVPSNKEDVQIKKLKSA